MSSNIKNILIIGATSGLGEGFAQRFHAQGANIIITGRRGDRLDAIKAELEKSGSNSTATVETLQWDINNLNALPATVSKILEAHPDLDTVFVNAGIQKSFSWLDASTSSDDSIANEISTNITAPFLLARAFVPYLTARASSGKHAAFLATSSGLAFVPFPLYPVYNATKSAVHTMMMGLRLQVATSQNDTLKKYLSITEIIPPYVDTPLDAEHRESQKDILPPPMPLKEYLDKTMTSLNELQENGKLKWEVGTGFGQLAADAWRGAIVPILDGRGLKEV